MSDKFINYEEDYGTAKGDDRKRIAELEDLLVSRAKLQEKIDEAKEELEDLKARADGMAVKIMTRLDRLDAKGFRGNRGTISTVNTGGRESCSVKKLKGAMVEIGLSPQQQRSLLDKAVTISKENYIVKFSKPKET